jgi:mono/diheme cytochrome c family protein
MKMTVMWPLRIGLLAVALVSGCGSSATFTQVNQQILTPSCVSCHHAGGQSPDLSSYASFATNTEYVVPGNPSQSLIYTVTESGQMPQNGPALTAAQEQLLSSWIAASAQND